MSHQVVSDCRLPTHSNDEWCLSTFVHASTGALALHIFPSAKACFLGPLIKCSLVSYAYLTALIPFCSPIGEVFRSRLHQFPSLVNCCTINWFSEWPDKALCSVATNFMQDITEIDVSNSISICLSVCLSVCVSVLPAFLYTVKVLGRRKIECVCVYVCGGSISVNFIYLMSIALCQSCNEGELIGLAFSKPQL